MSDSVVGDALDDLSKVKSRMGSTRVQPIRDFFCLYLLHTTPRYSYVRCPCCKKSFYSIVQPNKFAIFVYQLHINSFRYAIQ